MDLDTAGLLALAAVVDEGSFDAAAHRLGVTPSAVSQRVKTLERRTGQVLVRRARPCRATAAGQVLVRLAGQWELLAAEAVREVTGGAEGDDRSPVRLAIVVNADSLSTWFPPALAAMGDDVVFDVHREDQDHSAPLLREGTVMAAVTTDGSAVQGCSVHPLGAMRYLAVAAPSYLERWGSDGANRLGAPHLAALAGPMLAFNAKDALQEHFLRAALGDGAPLPPRHHVPSSSAFVELVRSGLGWGMVPDGAARADLAAGRLVELVPGRHLDVPLHWQHWRLGSPTLDELTRQVLAAARAGLHPPASTRRRGTQHAHDGGAGDAA